MLADEFCREARERGVHLGAEELEALHRTRLLVRFYRAAADPRALRAARRSRRWAFQLGHWSVPSRADMVEALSEDRLRDPDACWAAWGRGSRGPVCDASWRSAGCGERG
jgi:hypothetical protein